jgi:hypothetical protein
MKWVISSAHRAADARFIPLFLEDVILSAWARTLVLTFL